MVIHFVSTDLGANPGLRCERAVTNRLSHNTSINLVLYVRIASWAWWFECINELVNKEELDYIFALLISALLSRTIKLRCRG